jgi:predicted RNA binding protein YcfA (HicA-like mRNA interferase family)
MPRWKDLRRFLENEGYVLIRHGRDDIYEKVLPNGDINRVRVSKSSGEIKPGQFRRILKQQLGVDIEYFNQRVKKKKKEEE